MNEDNPEQPEQTEPQTPTTENKQRRVVLGGKNSQLFAMLAGSMARDSRSVTARLDADKRRRGRAADPQSVVNAGREALKAGHNPHQGKREKERRVRQMARDAANASKRKS